ncbi:YbjN domain-containing protein [Limnospira platensis CENA597]|uniref:YbjN domain-containing protein n=1 Tax=Limnospira platensis TaxID=118562 RepID=UPI003DA10708
MNLQSIQSIIDGEEFTTSWEGATSEHPIDRILVLLSEEKQLLAELLFIPVEEEVEDVHLLQFYVGLPGEVLPAAMSEIRQLLLRLNTTLPIGSFGIQEEEELLYFRYVLVIPQEEKLSAETAIIQSLWLVFYLVESFAVPIQEVARGEQYR